MIYDSFLRNHPPERSPSKAQRSLLRWAAGGTLLVAFLIGIGKAAGMVRAQIQLVATQSLCKQSLSEQDWPSVERAARNWLDLDASSGDAWLYLAQSLEEQNRPIQAATALSRVPISHPLSRDALWRQVELDFGPANRPLEAENALERLLKVDPHNPEVHRQIIGFHARTFQLTRLWQQIRDSIASEKEPAEAYLHLAAADSWLVVDSLPTYERWIQGHPDCPIFATAHALCLAHQHSTSTSGNSEQILATLHRFGDNAEVLAYHIEQSILAEDVEHVSTLLDQAPNLARSDHRFWRYAGWLHQQRGQLAEAESMFRQSLELHPLSWKTRRCLAALLAELGRHEETASMQSLADQGVELEQEIIRQGTRQGAEDSTPVMLLQRIATYAAGCQDSLVITGIARHLPDEGPRVSEISRNQP